MTDGTEMGLRYEQLMVGVYVFYEDDDITLAIAQVLDGDDVLHAYGRADRDPVDKNDKDLGRLIAIGRAMEKLTKKINKRAEGYVKHNDDVRADQLKKRLKAENECFQADMRALEDKPRLPWMGPPEGRRVISTGKRTHHPSSVLRGRPTPIE